ncbi:MAG: Nramp family divalent metal transporter [Stellaceae bacterium]
MHGTARSKADKAEISGWLTTHTIASARDLFEGRQRGLGPYLAFFGPAVVVSVAYIDPGNIATDIVAGARHGYLLLWVVVLANLIAMLFQALSARLGIVTGRNLAELCAEYFPRPVTLAMWLLSEVGAMATDLAEFLGAAVGLALLIGMPLLAAMVAVGVATYAVLMLERRGFRPLELVIGAMIAVVGVSYLIEIAIAPPDWHAALSHLILPRLGGSDAFELAVGIIGATVMPHVLFLHSGLTQARLLPRNEAERRRLIHLSNREVMIALGFAGLINLAMMLMAARVFFATGHQGVAEIATAYRTLLPLLGLGAATVFLVALLAAGLSSSVVGTMAGQIIMQGFVGFRIPVWLRRIVTMVPAFIIVALGAGVTESLVLSQVVLSIVLPVPMIALLLFTQRRDIMGRHANGPVTAVAAGAGVAIVLGLNALYLYFLIFA